MNLLTRTAIALALVLGLTACTARDSSLEAKIETQSKHIAEMETGLKALKEGMKDRSISGYERHSLTRAEYHAR
jgi:hypothetical protein